VREFPNSFDEENLKLIRKTPSQEEINDFIEVIKFNLIKGVI
jgi:hypothetical protein